MLEIGTTDRLLDAMPILNGHAEGEQSIVELVGILRSLLGKLEGKQDPRLDSQCWPGEFNESWEDESYEYFEVTLPSWAGSELDLNVTNGRAFIRVAR